MKSRTSPRRRHAARRLARMRRWSAIAEDAGTARAPASAVGVVLSTGLGDSAAALGLLGERVELLVELLQSGLQVAHLAGLVLREEVLHEVRIRDARRRDRGGPRFRVREDLQERCEVEIRLELR